MATMRLRHINGVRRKGRLYYYHRKTGERLPDQIEARALRVLEINASLHKPAAEAGTIAGLIAAYKASADFTALAPLSRRDYDRHLAAIEARLGAFRVQGIERLHVLRWRDKLSTALGARQANYRLTVLRRLFSFAVDRGWRADNPVAKFKRFREGPGYKAWPLELLKRALADAYPELRLAIAFIFLTGLRPTDAVRAAWTNLQGDRLVVVQGKTREPVEIPVGDALRALLAAAPRVATTILATKTGRAWQQNWLSREIAALAPGYVTHGLRETTGTELAGEGDAVIQAMLGHKTQSQAAHYRRHAAKIGLAGTAVARLDTLADAVGLQTTKAETAKRSRRVRK